MPRETVAVKAVKEKSGGRRRSRSAEQHTAALAGDVELVVDGERAELRPTEPGGEPDGLLKTLLREQLAGLDVERRTEVVDELASSPLLEEHGSLELSGSLYEIREGLRGGLPPPQVGPRQPVGLTVEQILVVDDRSFWVSGWMHDEDGEGEVTF